MITKQISDLQADHIIREAIQKIANKHIVNSRTGVINGTGKVTGYVKKIHTEGELAGTIDVQEYTDYAIADSGTDTTGYHEGVLLSAIQNNLDGLVVIPKLYSEVVVTLDPESGNEYVTMFSHVDVIQLDSHERVVVGVREREEFDTTNEDSPDIDELKLTGAEAKTSYTKDSITSTVQEKEDGENTTSITQTAEKIVESVGKDKSSVSISQDEIELKRDGAKTVMTSKDIVSSVGDNIVKLDGDVVYLGAESNTEHAVLGETLCDTLVTILDAIIQIKTTTQLGPQPPLNLASFIQMKAQIMQYKSALAGFLTRAVVIKK